MSKYLVYGKENPEESSKESNDLKSYYEENEFKPYIPQLDQGFTYRPDESFITPVSQEELQTP